MTPTAERRSTDIVPNTFQAFFISSSFFSSFFLLLFLSPPLSFSSVFFLLLFLLLLLFLTTMINPFYTTTIKLTFRRISCSCLLPDQHSTISLLSCRFCPAFFLFPHAVCHVETKRLIFTIYTVDTHAEIHSIQNVKSCCYMI